MHNVTIVDGHPDPARAHLVHALADRYAQAAQDGGCEVRRVNVAELDVPLLRVPSEFYAGEAPAAVRAAHNDLRRADHLVFFYPLWMSDMPAVLKAFLEQALRPGLILEYDGKALATLLRFGGVGPVRISLFGGLREGSHRAERWLEAMPALAAEDRMLALHGRRRWVRALQRTAVLAAIAAALVRVRNAAFR